MIPTLSFFTSVPAQCYTAVDQTCREYKYPSPPMFITSTSIIKNRAGDGTARNSNSMDISSTGGGLFAINLGVVLRNSNVAGNYAAMSGGGIHSSALVPPH